MRKIKKKAKIKTETKEYNVNDALNRITDKQLKKMHTKLSLLILCIGALVGGVAICF